MKNADGSVFWGTDWLHPKPGDWAILPLDILPFAIRRIINNEYSPQNIIYVKLPVVEVVNDAIYVEVFNEIESWQLPTDERIWIEPINPDGTLGHGGTPYGRMLQRPWPLPPNT